MDIIQYLKQQGIDATLEKYQIKKSICETNQNVDNPTPIVVDCWREIIGYLDVKSYCNVLCVCRFFQQFRYQHIIVSVFKNELRLNGTIMFNAIRKNLDNWLFRYSLVTCGMQPYFIIQDSNNIVYTCTITITPFNSSISCFRNHITINVKKDYKPVFGIGDGDVLKINKVHTLNDETDIDIIKRSLIWYPEEMSRPVNLPKRRYRRRKNNKRIKI